MLGGVFVLSMLAISVWNRSDDKTNGNQQSSNFSESSFPEAGYVPDGDYEVENESPPEVVDGIGSPSSPESSPLIDPQKPSSPAGAVGLEYPANNDEANREELDSIRQALQDGANRSWRTEKASGAVYVRTTSGREDCRDYRTRRDGEMSGWATACADENGYFVIN